MQHMQMIAFKITCGFDPSVFGGGGGDERFFLDN
jgi:hypothetical protein